MFKWPSSHIFQDKTIYITYYNDKLLKLNVNNLMYLTLILLEKASKMPTFLVLSCRLTQPSITRESPSCRTSLLLSTTATPAIVS